MTTTRRRRFSSALRGLALLSALLSTSTADAQPKPTPPSDVETDRARQLHIEADGLYAKGDYERARAAYLAAWALKKHWQIAASLGDCEIRLKLFRDAGEHLSYAVRTMPKDDRARLDKATGLLEEASTHVGAVTLSSPEADADVSVDGTVIGKTPLEDPIFLEPGPHAIELKKLGFIPKRVEVEAKAATTDTQSITLEPESSQATGSGGASNTTTSSTSSGAGGAQPQDDTPKKSIPILVTGSVLAIAGVGVGATLIGLGAKASGDRDDALGALKEPHVGACSAGTPHVETCKQIADDDDTYVSLTTGGGIALGLGAAVGLATLIYGVVPGAKPSEKKPSASWTVVPLFSPDVTGAYFVGAF